MRNNGTIYAHIFFTKHGMSPNPQSPHYSNRIRLYKQHLLNKYAPRQKVIVKKNLLTGENETSTQIVNMFQESNNTEIISYWKGNLTISLVHDFTEYTPESIPPLLAPYFQFDQHGNYYPVIFVNEFWIMREHLSPINDTVKFLPLEMTYEPISLLKWSMLLQIETSFSMQRTLFGTEESEVEEFKRILLDNHPAILALTFVVSLLHSIFDFLAFKNDIQFWRKRKSLEGLSVRTLYINFICNAIIFLYLLDNETSWLVLVSAGVGLLIEAWKITRAVHIRIVWWKRIPYVKFQDKNSYASSTRQYDLTAMKYLSYAFYPLVVGYAIYSLIYEQHKSWYSWIISTLAGFVYTFGFIAMTPQLFINYKKKSVAHLPWRAFVYRALNTFIDDLFAFIIRMPTMHRLRCFRDGMREQSTNTYCLPKSFFVLFHFNNEISCLLKISYFSFISINGGFIRSIKIALRHLGRMTMSPLRTHQRTQSITQTPTRRTTELKEISPRFSTKRMFLMTMLWDIDLHMS